MTMQRVASNIRKYRELMELTAEEVAAKLEMHYHAYQEIEAGRLNIGGDIIEKIADILEVDTQLLYGRSYGDIYFNGDNNSNNHGEITIHKIDKKLEALYEENIALLKEKIYLLEKENKALKQKPKI